MSSNDPQNPAKDTAFLVFDCESIPDGTLLARTRYPNEGLSPEEAVARAQADQQAARGNDFIPVSYQVPVSLCVARVDRHFRLHSIRCIDQPQYRPREITRGFWEGVAHYQARLVSFNGRGFDLPLMELAAYRYGISAGFYFSQDRGLRYRFGNRHIDLLDFLTNYGAYRLTGGLDLLSKLLGKPGKLETKGHQVYDLYRQGRVQEINEYCSFDVLDTYFVFLRTRVLVGELTLEREQELVRLAKDWLTAQCAEQPHFQRYLDHWGDWEPWL